uniref:Nucleoprotein n=1 Tax=human metapneumovirus TaxID=162145 RepID=A0A650FPV8_9MONO|nr:nucleoprotein [Human metapneumovirus]UZU57721.1 nucleoprotein [Human metapneumovirus]UZU57751.1 nucleoprotein [Human metapneumovirus]WFF64169.1 nucleoprotein [Human metapneumovirus]WFF64178.1 nucleoprotein [Human metapneumovirus]
MSLQGIHLSDLSYKHAILKESQYTIKRDVGTTTAVTPSSLQQEITLLCGEILYAKHTDYKYAAEIGIQYISTALGSERVQQILRNSGSEVQAVLTRTYSLGKVKNNKGEDLQMLDIHGVEKSWVEEIDKEARKTMATLLKESSGNIPQNQRPSAPDTPIILLCVGALIFTKLASTIEVGLETTVRRANRVLSDALKRFPRMDIPKIARSFYDLFEQKVYYRSLFIEYGKALGSSSTGSKAESLFVNIFMQAYGAGQTMLRWGVIARSSNNIMLGHVSVQAELKQVTEVYDLVREMGPESGLLHLRQSPKAGLLSLANCPNFASVVLGNASGLGIIGMYRGRVPNTELFSAAESYAKSLKESNKINFSSLGLTDEEKEAAEHFLNVSDDSQNDYE